MKELQMERVRTEDRINDRAAVELKNLLFGGKS
jgi:hypothetical protein